jgi:hypothetical protein
MAPKHVKTLEYILNAHSLKTKVKVLFTCFNPGMKLARGERSKRRVVNHCSVKSKRKHVSRFETKKDSSVRQT